MGGKLEVICTRLRIFKFFIAFRCVRVYEFVVKRGD